MNQKKNNNMKINIIHMINFILLELLSVISLKSSQKKMLIYFNDVIFNLKSYFIK